MPTSPLVNLPKSLFGVMKFLSFRPANGYGMSGGKKSLFLKAQNTCGVLPS
jgi:hypothetical protein